VFLKMNWVRETNLIDLSIYTPRTEMTKETESERGSTTDNTQEVLQ